MTSTSTFREMSCDTIVATGTATATGRTLFAKNSDRHPNEAQYLTPVAAAQHAAGSTVHCTYIAIPQAEQTHRVIGSRPWWLWGFEHGVNEHGVAVGNEALWSREPSSLEPGLLGMDLVRLVLERAQTAAQGVEILTALLDTHGQSGSTNLMFEQSYQNGFLIADPRDAWIVETAGRHWAAKQVDGVASISNAYSLGSDYHRLSADAQSYAESQGWFDPDQGRAFDFALAYADPELPFLASCTTRLSRSGALLGTLHEDGEITVEDMMAVLRDDHASFSDAPGWRPETDGESSLCMHAQDLNGSETAASIVADLSSDPLLHVSLASPCLSPFVPVWFNGSPVPWQQPDEEATEGSDDGWWQTELMQREVERDYTRLSPLVLPLVHAADAHTRVVLTSLPAEPVSPATRSEITVGALARRERVVGAISQLLASVADDVVGPAPENARGEYLTEMNARIVPTARVNLPIPSVRL